MQQLFASLLPTPVPTSTERSLSPSVQPRGVTPKQFQFCPYQPSSSSFLPATSHEQPAPASTYTPSSSSLRQAGSGEARVAFVVPAGNEVIVIDDDSTDSTPVKATANRGHSGPALSPARDHPMPPTPNTTVAVQADAAPASPDSGRSKSMDLSDSSVSNNVTIDASLAKAGANPGLSSQNEAMDSGGA